MLAKFFKVLSVVLSLAGLLLIMGAAGSVDYALEIGKEVPSTWITIGRAAGGFSCFLLSALTWRIANAY
jgi:hypothetical protein